MRDNLNPATKTNLLITQNRLLLWIVFFPDQIIYRSFSHLTHSVPFHLLTVVYYAVGVLARGNP